MKKSHRLFLDDSLLILTMATLAGCGLIYEYLLAHYSGRVLGIMESTIYTMIGLMIVAMGLGAFAARKIKCPFNGFIWLELIIAFLGSIAILSIAGFIAVSQILPQVIAETFTLPPDAIPKGGMFKQIAWLAFKTPYIFGFALGFFIGMEIPLIARIREIIHKKHLVNNLGTMYGADYIGAGIGAAIWVIFLLAIDINKAAAITASLNLIFGGFFLIRFWPQLKWKKCLTTLHLCLLGLILIIFQHGSDWLNKMSNLLYLDNVVYQTNTRYQQLTFTERYMGTSNQSILNFYINGRLQFSQSDEFIYHDYLVTPVLAGSARQEKILIIGGGDGLALRNILAWQPKNVTLIDLDKELVELFKNPENKLSPALAMKITNLTKNSLLAEQVNIINQDAFIAIDDLISQGHVFDAIIVDLPDPNHPDLNKLYSVNFYARLKQLLSGDGLLGIQSTSPYHAKNAFISIGKTVLAAKYSNVEQYHDNVPTFGEWGWTIASKFGASPSQRLNQLTEFPVENSWLTPDILKGAFHFPANFYQNAQQVPINYLGSHNIYQLHQAAWQKQQGLNSAHLQ